MRSNDDAKDQSLTIALVYELKRDYLARGYTREQCEELEEDDTLDALENALRYMGHHAVRVGDIKDLVTCLARGGGSTWDLVFSTSEGIHGNAREAQVPALLEAYQIPFIGADAVATVLCHDKAKTKMILAHYGIATAPFCVARNNSTAAEIIASFRSKTSTLFHMFVKPVAEGSSKGVRPDCKIAREADLQQTVDRLKEQYPQQDILIERFLSGREFTIGVVGTGAKAQVIGATELCWKQQKSDSYSYGGTDGGTSLSLGVDFYTLELKRCLDLFEACVACIPADLESDIEARKACESALAAYRILGCRDVGRVDVRSDMEGPGAVPHIIEVNPRPGLRPNFSDLIVIAKNAGLSYEELIQDIVDSALNR